MNLISLLFAFIAIIVIQGCTVKGLDKSDISKYDLLMQVNQDFSCMQFVGGANNISLEKNQLFPVFSLPKDLKLGSGLAPIDYMNEDIPDTAIFLKIDTSSPLMFDAIRGFLIYPDGTFVFNTKQQFGFLKNNKFLMFTDCSWEGKTPFSPLRREDIK